jgi:hypothetical protein
LEACFSLHLKILYPGVQFSTRVGGFRPGFEIFAPGANPATPKFTSKTQAL